MILHRELAVRELLLSIGEDPDREGLVKTPHRVAKMYNELFAGYNQNAEEILTSATFESEGSNEMVIVRNIEFFSHCEHHMVPFYGKAHVAYIPNGRVVGLSKIARVVEMFARRLQIQERMTMQIADAMQEALDPLGVMVVIEAEHMCMKMRGVKNPCADTVTSAVRGVFRDPKEHARTEFLSLMRK